MVLTEPAILDSHGMSEKKFQVMKSHGNSGPPLEIITTIIRYVDFISQKINTRAFVFTHTSQFEKFSAMASEKQCQFQPNWKLNPAYHWLSEDEKISSLQSAMFVKRDFFSVIWAKVG